MLEGMLSISLSSWTKFNFRVRNREFINNHHVTSNRDGSKQIIGIGIVKTRGQKPGNASGIAICQQPESPNAEATDCKKMTFYPKA
jgi:hypothetical protein